jgi:hypothetical protein
VDKDTIDKVFAEILGTQTPAHDIVSPPRPKPAVTVPAPPSQYDEAARSLRSPADHFFSALGLLKSPKYMNRTFDTFGHWDYKRSLWVNQNKSTVTLQEMETEMVLRCAELNVDRELVEAHGKSVLSIAESQAFSRLSFEEKMVRFRKASL